MNSEIEDFFVGDDQWFGELQMLRPMVLASGLVEELKWGQPCYTHNGKNVLMIAPFAKYCALAFFGGVLLRDDAGLLVSPGKDSQSVRQLRFADVGQIEQHRGVVAAYIAEMIEHVDAGTKVAFPAKNKLELPDELVERFDDVDGLEDAFHALTPGRQRGIVLHIAGAKQSATRGIRVENNLDRILAGKGIHDCVCGKSARMPRCDGSHAR